MERWAFEEVLAFTRSWDAVYFTAMFIAAAIYAYWPKNKAKFEAAARIPFEDEGH